jgi:hypothetical protein
MNPHPVLIEAPVLVPASALVAFGRSLLEKAEAARRVGVGDGPITQSGEPDGDYAAATLLISGAMHHLDESLPNRQVERTRAALGALQLGTVLLADFLARHWDVSPPRATVGAKAEVAGGG